MFFKNLKEKIFSKKTPWTFEIYAPCDGEIVPQKDIPDEGFSAGYMGVGLGIKPINNNIYSPCTGNLSVVFDTGHAYGIKDHTKDVYLLVHIGVDTVAIPKTAKAFNFDVKQNDHIKVNDKLVTMDLNVIRKLAPSDVVILVVQNENMEDKKVELIKKSGTVKQGDLLMVVSEK